MPSKKKPRALFEVPAETESEGPAGWVYRSDSAAAKDFAAEDSIAGNHSEVGGAVNDDALALAFAMMTQALALGAMLAVIPVAMSMRALDALRRQS